MESKIESGVQVLVLTHNRRDSIEAPKYGGIVKCITEDGQFACVRGGWAQWWFCEWVSAKHLRVIKPAASFGPAHYPTDNGWHYSPGE